MRGDRRSGAVDAVCLSRRSAPARPYNRRSGGRELLSRRGGCAPARPRAARPRGRAPVAMRSRLAPAALVAALLVATSVAFVVTEKLKLTRSPIIGPTVAKVFSPTCDCETSTAEIRFRLRKADRVSVEIVDSRGHVVRELARDRPQGRRFVAYTWDGRDSSGRVVDEGTYKPRVHLDRQRRTIVMPNLIRVDTTPPRVTTFTARPLVISPDGDGRFDRAKIRYRVDERSQVELYVDGVRALRQARHPHHRNDGLVRHGRRRAAAGGPAHAAARRPRPRGQPRPALGLAHRPDPLPRPGSRPRRDAARRAVRDPGRSRRRDGFAGASASGRAWRARAPLRLRAPDKPGRYVLRVDANGHVQRALVVVRAAPR